ncbi:YfhO family protein [Planococcus sp. YIM B11945]|uniref:YfhO family protein n=1 Tax=Planococcus sp. YIM B11945 TaxID=3435410 RepID=UPI003D7E62AB
MQKKYPNSILFAGSFVLAILSHAVFLFQWSQNHFMIGINDGLAQMMPFKHLLYEQYTNGEFFYSFSFGLGAGTYSGLSYYFSTSLIFWLTALIVFILETLGLIGTPDVLFWAHAAVFISIVRLTFVLYITSRVFMYMKIPRVYAFIGACLYGISGMFFRHTAYWEFFADAFLWLPLLILGIEKIFREAKPGWFIAAVAISLINNFYFSYINLLLAGIYILVRLFISLAPEETGKKKAIGLFLLSGILGFGISTVSFIPSVYAYLNNHRPPFSQDIPWVLVNDNILFTSRFIIVPALFIVLLFCAVLYQNVLFRFFAVLGLIALALHHSPLAASAFNGFSAPQYRWEYFLSFAAGGLIAVGLANLHKVKTRYFSVAAILTVGCYLFWASHDETLKFDEWIPILMAASLPVTLVLGFCFVQFKKNGFKLALIGFLFVWMLTFVNLYQIEKLLDDGGLSQVSEELITGTEYDDPEVRKLIESIQQQDKGPTYRIDWMEGVRNNTPLVQNFRGTSAYSSILNKNLLFFYLYDLEIDMGRESVSRYATLGNRANLHSMIQGKYIILPKDDPNVPFGFSEAMASENFIVYENENLLPFARSASTVFLEKQLEDAPALAREHAMLKGIVLDEGQSSEPLPEVEAQTEEFAIKEAGARYVDGTLMVEEKVGGIDLVRNGDSFTEGDLYVSFHLENHAPTKGFDLTVNSYETSRKSNRSVYKTYVDDITIRIPADDTISIRMPKGTYDLTELQVYEEPYDVLLNETGKPSGLSDLEIGGHEAAFTYSNSENDPYLSVSIPYERGWSATVNGKKTAVLKANYAFIGVPLENGQNTVHLTYHPPFFYPTLLVSLLSLTLACWYVFKRKKPHEIAGKQKPVIS